MNADEREMYKLYIAALRNMPKFSNSANEPWREFETQWRQWALNHELEVIAGLPKQKAALISAMKGRATRAVNQHGQGTASFNGAATLEAYITLVRECFNPPAESQTARTDFERRKQGRTEPAVSYLAEKTQLYYHALPTAAARSFTYFKSEVLKGIYASYVKEKIIERDPATEAELETCVADAVGKGRALYFGHCGKIADLDGLSSTTRQRAVLADGSSADVEAMDYEESFRRMSDNDGKCHTCKKPGHFARNCPNKSKGGQNSSRKPNPDRDVVCNECKKKGHRRANCWQLHPELKKGRKGGNQQKGGQKGQKHRRIGPDPEEEDQGDEAYGDFEELDEDEGSAHRVYELEPEHPFWMQAVPQSGRGNRLN